MRPADVVPLRYDLLTEWSKPHSAYSLSVAKFAPDWGIPGSVPIEGWEVAALRSAGLWWISADMVDVLLRTAGTVPAETLPTDIEAPSPYGLAVFEKPWLGSDAMIAGNVVEVWAVLWGISMLPPLHGGSTSTTSTTFSMYRQMDDGMWLPLGHSDWPLGDRLDAKVTPQMPDETLASFIEDRRLIAALFTLLTQAGITTIETTALQRQPRRRLERCGVPPELAASSVKVVTLRRRASGATDATSGDREYSHRWLVDSYWRHTAHGPGRSLRKLQLVEGYVAGPEDKPLVLKETVRSWQR